MERYVDNKDGIGIGPFTVFIKDLKDTFLLVSIVSHICSDQRELLYI
jgi:hypothetical protein